MRAAVQARVGDLAPSGLHEICALDGALGEDAQAARNGHARAARDAESAAARVAARRACGAQAGVGGDVEAADRPRRLGSATTATWLVSGLNATS